PAKHLQHEDQLTNDVDRGPRDARGVTIAQLRGQREGRQREVYGEQRRERIEQRARHHAGIDAEVRLPSEGLQEALEITVGDARETIDRGKEIPKRPRYQPVHERDCTPSGPMAEME